MFAHVLSTFCICECMYAGFGLLVCMCLERVREADMTCHSCLHVISIFSVQEKLSKRND